MLRVLATALGDTARPGDIVGRIDGAAFSFAVVDAGADVCQERARHVRHRFDHVVREMGVQANVFVGVASSEWTSPDQLGPEADRAVARAKRYSPGTIVLGREGPGSIVPGDVLSAASAAIVVGPDPSVGATDATTVLCPATGETERPG